MTKLKIKNSKYQYLNGYEAGLIKLESTEGLLEKL